MSKLKENFLFVIIVFTVMTVFMKISYYFLCEEKPWTFVLIQCGVATLILFILKFFKSLSQKKHSNEINLISLFWKNVGLRHLKQNILFTLIFFIGFVATYKIIYLVLGENRSWSEIIQAALFFVFIFLIAKLFGLIDKKKKEQLK